MYELLDIIMIFSFVTPFLANRFDVHPKILSETFLIGIPMGESVTAKKSI